LVASSVLYKDSYKSGLPITGLPAAAQVPGVEVFHAGTSLKDGRILTAGGRVLGVTAAADTLADALARAYQAMAEIGFEGMYFRRDIGHRALKSKQASSSKT
ncbi:MAG: phosphoribosylglycinamide synthetase C domain-containing protein, partial [Terracidiphilus sp.]